MLGPRLQEALELICRAGFDVRLAKPNGSLGAGLYFGTSSVTSSSYCCKMFDRSAVNALGHRPAELLPAPVAPEGTAPRFHPGGFSMLLCRVAVGRAGSGQSGARAPQPGCHSAASHNTMHVVYRSDQVGCCACWAPSAVAAVVVSYCFRSSPCLCGGCLAGAPVVR